MEPESPDAEAMRRRLYRPGASPADLATYLQVVGEPSTAVSAGPGPVDGVEEQRGPSGGSRRRLFVVGGIAAVVVVALIGGGFAAGDFAPSRGAAPRPSATIASTSGPRIGDDALTGGFQDGGARPTASGAAAYAGPMGSRLGGSGASAPAGRVRYLYTVAARDTVYGITTRFGLCAADVVAAAPYGFDWARPAPGTVLLLQRTATFPSRNATGTC